MPETPPGSSPAEGGAGLPRARGGQVEEAQAGDTAGDRPRDPVGSAATATTTAAAVSDPPPLPQLPHPTQLPMTVISTITIHALPLTSHHGFRSHATATRSTFDPTPASKLNHPLPARPRSFLPPPEPPGLSADLEVREKAPGRRFVAGSRESEKGVITTSSAATSTTTPTDGTANGEETVSDGAGKGQGKGQGGFSRAIVQA
ncbi:hypothetical protein BDZ91DRAFT_714871 [Kalaharituber pfeilii]|nr:hypothetical protein BDZ91DRAFT_714871 [Kalaharituber pfeilii]